MNISSQRVRTKRTILFLRTLCYLKSITFPEKNATITGVQKDLSAGSPMEAYAHATFTHTTQQAFIAPQAYAVSCITISPNYSARTHQWQGVRWNAIR